MSGVTMEWLMEDSISPDAKISLARMTLAAGVRSECHRHPNCAETIHLEAGRIRQRIGDKWIVLKAGETCVIPEGTPHQSENLGETDAVMMLCYVWTCNVVMTHQRSIWGHLFLMLGPV